MGTQILGKFLEQPVSQVFMAGPNQLAFAQILDRETDKHEVRGLQIAHSGSTECLAIRFEYLRPVRVKLVAQQRCGSEKLF